jgi:hypothetical protein
MTRKGWLFNTGDRIGRFYFTGKGLKLWIVHTVFLGDSNVCDHVVGLAFTVPITTTYCEFNSSLCPSVLDPYMLCVPVDMHNIQSELNSF